MYNTLSIQFPSLQREYKPYWSQNKRYDFLIPEMNTIIELDGRQHFVQVKNWQSPDSTQSNDIQKMKNANENGYRVIRLLQEDVLNDTYDWFDELKNVILNTRTMTVYLCKNNEYDFFNI